MAPRHLAILALLGGSTAAHADAEASAGVDFAAESRNPTTAGAGGSEVETQVGGSIEGAASAPEYGSFIRGAGSATLRAGSDGAGLTIQQQASLRPWELGLFDVTFADRLALDVAPKLSDRPDRWRRRYTEAGFDVDMIWLQYRGDHVGVQLVRIDNGFSWESQHDGQAAERRFVSTADWAPLSITRRRTGEEIARFDLVALEARSIAGEHSGVVLTTFFPRITGIPLGPATLDLAFGHASTGYSQISVDGQVVSTTTSDQLPEKRVPAARARLAAKLGDATATITAERGMYLAMDAALVVEERATAQVATTVDGVDLRAAGFAAHSVIWTSKTESSEHVTGGASVGVDFAVADRWKLQNQAELARTFYASIDGDRTPRADTALRLDVALHHEIRNWVPR